MVWFNDNGLLIRFPATSAIAHWLVSISGDGYIDIEYRIDGLIGARVVPVTVWQVFWKYCCTDHEMGMLVELEYSHYQFYAIG